MHPLFLSIILDMQLSLSKQCVDILKLVIVVALWKLCFDGRTCSGRNIYMDTIIAPMRA